MAAKVVICEACSRALQLKADFRGESVRCPHCKASVRVPPQTQPADPADDEMVVENAAEEDEPARPRRGIPWSLLFSLLALLVSAGALARILLHDPLGTSINKYDFTSPKAALLSDLKMQENHDLRASFELDRLTKGRKKAEKLRTIEIHRQAEWRGAVLLFTSFEEGGAKKHEVFAFEKDAETGFWVKDYFSVLRMDEKDEPLRSEIKLWEAKPDLREGHK